MVASTVLSMSGDSMITVCWNCKTIQKIGTSCTNCNAPVIKAYDLVEFCPGCGKKCPRELECTRCKDKLTDKSMKYSDSK